MIRSDTLDALSAALSAAQGEFEAVSKTASNPFYKSAYSPLPEVVKAAAPILSKHGLAVWQGADTDETGELLWTIVMHKSGQFIGSAARMKPVKNDPQAQGSAQTYGRRYQYMAALGLVADDDDDGEAATRPKPSGRKETRTQPTTRTPSPEGHSEAKDASQDGAEDSPPVGTETLEKIAAATRKGGLKVP